MWQLNKNCTEPGIDPQELESALASLTSCDATVRPFDQTKPISAGRAPGRLDVMGGIADYSGSTVLQLPLHESVWAFCQLCQSRDITVISEVAQSADAKNAKQTPRIFRCSVEHIMDYHKTHQKTQTTLHEYFATHHIVGSDNEQVGKVDQQAASWAAYIVGVLPVLMQEYKIGLQHGLSIYLLSSVPEGKGVSSSAAVELATMRAITHALQLDVSAEHQAVLSQRVENTIVGAPCGIMDQMTSSVGRKDQLLRLLCQPHDVLGHIKIPNNMALWGIDSGLRHAVSGSDYTSVRVATFMGYRIILKLAGIAEPDVPMHKINDTKWHGYLANISLDEFNNNYLQQLPETLSGKAFLSQFSDHADATTTIDEEHHYAVRTCTSHPVNEHFRVNAFTSLLQSLAHSDSNENATGCDPSQNEQGANSLAHGLMQLGEYMYQSHSSYTACGLNSTGTDELVSMIRDAGVDKEIYGARITGGGSGGTVVVLTGSNSGDAVRCIATEYAQKSGMGGYVFSHSSNGAFACALQPYKR